MNLSSKEIALLHQICQPQGRQRKEIKSVSRLSSREYDLEIRGYNYDGDRFLNFFTAHLPVCAIGQLPAAAMNHPEVQAFIDDKDADPWDIFYKFVVKD